jgi:chitodextrinase
MMKIKTFLQIVTVCLFALASLNPALGKPHKSLKSPHVIRNNNVMVLEYDFEEPVIITEGDYDVVTVDGLETYIEPGAPRIPVKPVQILVPAGMEIEKITSQAMDTCQLPDTYLLSHGTEQFRKDLGPPETPTQPNPEIYSMTTFWPAEQHELVTVQTNRGYNIAHVILFPLQYAPKDGKIKMAAKMQLKIRFTSIDSPRGAKPTKHLKKKLKRKLENPDAIDSYGDFQARSGGSPLSDPGGPYYGANYDYIVITNETFAGLSDQYSFQALCDSKAARGISAGIVTTEWIYANYDGTKPSGGTDNATRIRNFLIDAYETWGTEYALLAGDKDIIPARLFEASGTDIPADLYYGCVDPADCTFDYDADGTYGETNDGPGGSDIDLSADIFVGRAGVESTTEVIYFVKKTLFYESTSDPYLNHALSSGGYLGFGGVQEYSKPFCELVRLGSDLYLGHFACGFLSPGIANARDFTVATLYDADGIWDATTDLLPILNGTGGNTTPQLIYCGDHGSPYWGFTKLTTQPTSENNCDCICNLTNTRPFFFYDDSCKVGQFTVEDCFSEEITVGIEYGAFSCITLSQSGFGSSENNLDSVTTMFTREFFHSVLGEGIFELGAALQEARDSCLWRSGMGGFRYAYFEENLFGDPELRLRVTKDRCSHTCGDQDGAGVNVDMLDFGLFANCWAKNPQIDPNCVCANLVEFDDHIIDLLDLYVLVELFLSSSESYAPNCSTSITDPYAPTPDPMAFSSVPAATGDSSIVMTASAATDISGVEYYFTCTAGGGNDSGWQDSRTYEDTGLSPLTEYTYTVTARDKSANYNQTAASAAASATTDSPDTTAPVPNPMTWDTAPNARSSSVISMTATTASDSSGVEYFFDCITDDDHDSGWQDSRTYEDTGLTPETEYTYTVKARDKSAAHNQTEASAPASATTDAENIILPVNGGVLESFTSEYGSGWFASDLTNGVTNEDGWSSAKNPAPYQEFVYSFRDRQDAILYQAVIYGGTAEGLYYSKDVEVWISADGTNYTIAASGMLLAQSNYSITLDLGDTVANRVKLVITSGYRSDYWELSEFVVNGVVIN